jgi:hypothetical protein
MYQQFFDCNKVLRRNYEVMGIRKLETTWNFLNNKFHPHYHVIIRGLPQAERLVKEWLKRNTNSSKDAQDLRKADNGSLVEVFKYASKMYSIDKSQENGIRVYPPEVMLHIFKNLRKRKVLQPFGSMRKIKDDFSPDEATVRLENGDGNTYSYLWEHEYRTWIDHDTGEDIISGDNTL